MKIKIYLSLLALALLINSFGQKPTFELTFTAVDNTSYIQLDSIKVINGTQGGDTVLFWPDTVLLLDYQVGITKISNGEENLHLFQNYPNPVKDQSILTLYLPEKGKVNLMISDILGRQVINTEKVLERGYHTFRFTPEGGEIYFFTAYWNGTCSSIKILAPGKGSGLSGSLEYTGSKITEPQLKRIVATQNFSFSPGDKLRYTGYANGLQSGMLDAPETNKTYTFQFAYNIPCPGTPTVTYEGQVYNTVQIFSQCWMKENLNVGIMIPGTEEMENNGVIEKYCYDNNPFNCGTYGGMYQWDEMMNYTTQAGEQGICPPNNGWHIPDDEEWDILMLTLGGIDVAGGKMKETGTTHWTTPNTGATNESGFSALPGGYHSSNDLFGHIGTKAYFWSSTDINSNNAWYRWLNHFNALIMRDGYFKYFGFSVRCLRY